MGNPPKFTPTRNQNVLSFGSKIFADALSEDEVLVDGGGLNPKTGILQEGSGTHRGTGREKKQHMEVGQRWGGEVYQPRRNHQTP